MSDLALQRRYEDKRMDKLESDVTGLQKDVSYIKTKIDNGFSHSIKNTEERLTRFEKRYDAGHINLTGKIDKLLFIIVSGSIGVLTTIIASVILLFIKGVL